MKRVLLDAGPLVAYLDTADQHHAWAVAAFRQLTQPVFTCEAVLSEACHLLDDAAQAVRKICTMLDRGIVIPDFTVSTRHTRVFALMDRYADVPMSFADACLICMSEDSGGGTVFTVDGDFLIYRINGRRPVPLLAPAHLW